jgi:signal transduction histidine kinase/DNA-binding response OmpR family regulator
MRQVITPLSTAAGLLDKNVYPLFEDRDGSVWIGTFSALSHYKDGNVNNYTRRDGLLYDIVQALHQDRAGRLWIGSLNGVQYRESGKFTDFTERLGIRVGDFDFWAIHQDRNGALWFGTSKGLIQYGNGAARRLTTENGLPSNDVKVIHEARDGSLWIGTYGGVARLSERDEAGEGEGEKGRRGDGEMRWTVAATYTERDGLASNHVRAIYEDEQGTFWIGTYDGGLSRFREGKFTNYTTKNGLYSNGVFAILEDARGNFWMSSNQGIYRVRKDELNDFAERKQKTIMSIAYGKSDGMLNVECNGGRSPAGIKTRDGRLWFPTQDGVAIIDPKHIFVNPNPPPVVIEDVTIDNQSVAYETIQSAIRNSRLPSSLNGGGQAQSLPASARGGLRQAGAIQIQPHQQNFEIHYIALSFINSANLRFRYKLEGLDEEWVEAGTRRTAYYTHAPPGEYTFRVIAANSDGVWNETGTAIQIIIIPPWWQTWWAYTLYAILSAAALVGFIKRRELALRKRTEELEAAVAQRTSQVVAQKEQLELQSESLQELDHAKSRFFANISHEFRTPLTLILGPIQSMLSKAPDPADQQNLEMMKGNAKHLLQLINQLLELSKLESGKLQLQARRQDAISFLRGITSTFESLAQRKNIQLLLDAGEEMMEMYFDGEKLEHVFTNLLSNAVKFTPEGGKVSVVVAGERHLSAQSPAGDGHLEVRVKDTGVGIPKDKLPFVFDRFFQAQSASTRAFEGTGIGLSLAKELVELHRGTIEIKSEEGWGTEVIVRLPLGREHLGDDEVVETVVTEYGSVGVSEYGSEGISPQDSDTPILRHSDTLANADTPEQPLLLIVEDNADMRTYIHRQMKEHYSVIEAKDGAEGFERAAELIPDIVISDVMMPVMDGYTLCKKLKADEKTSHIPIVLLTAKAAQEEKLAGLEIGADEYLAKPFDVNELGVRVRNLIKIRQTLREKFSTEKLREPGRTGYSNVDEAFLNRAIELVNEYLDSEAFNVEALAEKMKMSRSQLHRKISSLTNQPVVQFIRSIRLKHAEQLLHEGKLSITEIAYATGFGSQPYFTKVFREQHGCTPTEFLHRIRR